jgi:hypothetical protein
MKSSLQARGRHAICVHRIGQQRRRDMEGPMELWNRLRGGVDDGRTRAMRSGRVVRARVAGDDRPNPWLLALPAAVLGALASYLLDPDRGRSRRARLADQAAGLTRRGMARAQRGARMIGSTIEGKSQAFRHRGEEEAMPNDAALADKVESELFRDPSIPKGKININVEQGRVVLRGEVDDDAQRRKLERQASRVPGVWSVENLLHLPGERAPGERVSASS